MSSKKLVKLQENTKASNFALNLQRLANFWWVLWLKSPALHRMLRASMVGFLCY
jgi:hypothetical protein